MNPLRAPIVVGGATAALVLAAPVPAVGQDENGGAQSNPPTELQEAYPLDQPEGEAGASSAASPSQPPDAVDLQEPSAIDSQQPAGGDDVGGWSPALWVAIVLAAALALYLLVRGLSWIADREGRSFPARVSRGAEKGLWQDASPRTRDHAKLRLEAFMTPATDKADEVFAALERTDRCCRQLVKELSESHPKILEGENFETLMKRTRRQFRENRQLLGTEPPA